MLSGISYLPRSDNSVTCDVCRTGKSGSPGLHRLVTELKSLEMLLQCVLTVVHLPGDQIIAQGSDGLSRGLWMPGGHESSTWSVKMVFTDVPDSMSEEHGLTRNADGGVCCRGKPHQFEKKLEVCSVCKRHREESGSRPVVQAVARECGVSRKFVLKFEQELCSHGAILHPKSQQQKRHVGPGACSLDSTDSFVDNIAIACQQLERHGASLALLNLSCEGMCSEGSKKLSKSCCACCDKQTCESSLVALWLENNEIHPGAPKP